MNHRVIYNNSFYGQELKEWAKEYLNHLPPEVDTLATRGSSGCTIASAMLVLSNRPLYHKQFRKENEKAHASYSVGHYGYGKIVIVDDFMDTGETINKIIENLAHDNHKATCIIVSHQFNPLSRTEFNGIPLICLVKI